ncbi:MAG TPA: PepSY-associated TM helix domain-containing protein [Polyangiales bacterium]
MYQALRKLHSWSGLAVLPFVLVYAFSAARMAHPELLAERIDTRTFQAELRADPSDPQAVLRELRERHVVRGELKGVRRSGRTLTLHVVRPGTEYDIEVTAGTSVASVREHFGGVVRMLDRLHHAAGLWHGFAPTNVWGACVVLASLALIVLALSGAWLWLQRLRERRLGLLFLTTSLVYALTLLVLIRLQ